MYSTKTATVNDQEFVSSYMPVGINENVTLKEVNVNKSPQGRDFLEIVFENDKGQTATMTEWKNEKNMWIKTDEDLQHRDDQQFGRILQVIDAVTGKHDDFEGSSFVEMINWAKSQLDRMIAVSTSGTTEEIKMLVRLKVVYDKRGYTKVSTLGIFIEPMAVTESKVKLWKNDLLERPVVADNEAADPLTSTAVGSTPVTDFSDVNPGADDLPF